ncbi:iron-sulfur cluster-binding domain-containing protein [Hufsiella ginkgonis]|uniref:2Fe-2S iron-sulfur cluster binding domain-containing protein n=1 Tax=Hufsiella ginkgonis TaxID=2695274 RepID=A0A7K1XY15_9SPHI|nr:iron-sulfur cluster-binding domain-containing protein [Hufsiella ginkgonis]MXV15894.1 2Fe-2S iron-sulfur cluster binding domain-containing protein [Hufsiella ginkgonis]
MPLRFRIVSIVQETSQAKTYTLEQVGADQVSWEPGQFLTFIFGIDGKELRRSYSIVSLPGEPLQVTIKKVENGAASRYALIHLKEGQEIAALAPAGRFVLTPQKLVQRDIFFIVAGSGITPVLPQLRRLLVAEPQSAIHLFYSNHSEQDTLFMERLTALQRSHPQLQVYWFFSDPASRSFPQRRLNNGILEIMVREKMRFAPGQAVFMICGPFTFMRMARITLIFMHVEEDRIRRENFLPEIMRSSPGTAHHFEDHTVTLEFNGTSYRLPVRHDETILRAAMAHHIPLPYSCEGGVCSTCAARCTRGKVEMTVNEVLTNQDLAEGWILTCTGHPVSENVWITFDVR